MNINDLTIGQAKELANLFSSQNSTDGLNQFIGKECIVRTYSAGVWFGEVSEKAGNEVILNNARRLWKWKTKRSISLSSIAAEGVDKGGCKFAPVVEQVWLEAIEIIPCTDTATQSIKEVEDAEVN